QFENKGKESTAVSSNNLSKLDSFMVGDYNLSANKQFKDSKVGVDDSVSGNLHINTDKVNSKGQVVAEEQFPQAWFRVKLTNTKELDDDYNLYINDKRVPYSKTQTYGKYPNDLPLKVKATGKIKKTTSNTKEVEIVSNKKKDKKARKKKKKKIIKKNKAEEKKNKKNATQTLNLKFDDKQIDKQLKKKKDIKKDAQKFLEEYTEDLNRAYEKSSFAGLKK